MIEYIICILVGLACGWRIWGGRADQPRQTSGLGEAMNRRREATEDKREIPNLLEGSEALLGVLGESHKVLVESAKEMGAMHKYGATDGQDDLGKWDEELLKAVMGAADSRITASLVAYGVSTYTHNLLVQLERLRVAIETEVEVDTDLLAAHQEGMRVALDCIHSVLVLDEPMDLYERYMGILNKDNEAVG